MTEETKGVELPFLSEFFFFFGHCRIFSYLLHKFLRLDNDTGETEDKPLS